MTKRESMLVQRFPRMQGITPRVRLTEKLLQLTYNTLAKGRNSYLKSSFVGRNRMRNGYDVYQTKMGRRAPFTFLCLAQELNKRRIDPSLYLKVMSQYGRWANTRWMPHPTWLGSDKALEIFTWKYRKELEKYERKSDWDRALRTNNEGDIVSQIEHAATMVITAEKSFNMEEAEAVMMLLEELSPWYLAAYIGSGRENSREIRLVVKTHEELRGQVLKCLHYFGQEPRFWRLIKKLFSRI